MNLISFLTNPAILPIIIGLGSASHIEAAVEYFKSNWELPTQLAPYAALVLAIGVNFGVAAALHLPITETIVNTFLTTGGAVFWHEFSSPSK